MSIENLTKRLAAAKENKLVIIPGISVNQLETAIAEVTELHETIEALRRIFEMQRTRERPHIERWRAETGKHDCLPDYGDMLQWLINRTETADNLVIELARHIRNTDKIDALEWGSQAMDLLAKVHAAYTERYNNEVSRRKDE